MQNKTLKDMNIMDLQAKWLRAEAVKWIKEDMDLIKDNTIFRMTPLSVLDFITARWEKRLNLTEEDLK